MRSVSLFLYGPKRSGLLENHFVARQETHEKTTSSCGPRRISPDDEDVLVSPADGKVILIEKVFDDKFVKEHVYKVSIFMNVFNVHVNRSPCPGTVTQVQYFSGMFFSADTERGALENEACGLTIETRNNRKIAVVQVAG